MARFQVSKEVQTSRPKSATKTQFKGSIVSRFQGDVASCDQSLRAESQESDFLAQSHDYSMAGSKGMEKNLAPEFQGSRQKVEIKAWLSEF